MKEQQRNGSRFVALADVDIGEFSSDQTAPAGMLLNQAHGGVASGVLDGSHGRDTVVQVPTSLNMENHVAVHIDNKKAGSKLSTLPARGQKIPKKDTILKGGQHMVVANRVTSLLADLDSSKVEASGPFGATDNFDGSSNSLVQWWDNVSYENQISDGMQE
ncbi:hypothetical protein V6N12_043072 [Hibiscus sabdariffa]|uniref:Uncharacterized protein n=1 Tax=Hibiscus sabdariffa TaxID=183260 RepID=A0ABR2DI45_9ROSI